MAILDLDGNRITPKEAAKQALEEALDQINHREESWFGENLYRHTTDRERELVDDQIRKILRRIDRLL